MFRLLANKGFVCGYLEEQHQRASNTLFAPHAGATFDDFLTAHGRLEGKGGLLC